MPATTVKLTTAVEEYFGDVRRIRASGGATGELSFYPALTNLLNAVGNTLSPKVFCVGQLAEQGAGHPDFGLYTRQQMQKGKPRPGQIPERGVVEVKPAGDDAWLTADSDQVSRYRGLYRLVLVTNTRDFVLVGEDAQGNAVKLETFRLAESEQAFHSRLEKPREFAHDVGARPGGVPVPGAVPQRVYRRAEGLGLADGLLRQGRAGESGGCRRRAVAPCRALGLGGGPGRALRG